MNIMMLMILIHGIIILEQHLLVIGEEYLKPVTIQKDHILILGKCLALLKNQHGGILNILLQHIPIMVVVINQCGKI